MLGLRSCRVDVNSSVSRPVLETEPCHAVAPHWDATGEAVLLEAEELQPLRTSEVFHVFHVSSRSYDTL